MIRWHNAQAHSPRSTQQQRVLFLAHSACALLTHSASALPRLKDRSVLGLCQSCKKGERERA